MSLYQTRFRHLLLVLACIPVTGLATPTVISINPSQVDAGGPAFTVTITGIGFVAGATVSIGSVTLPSTVVSASQLTVIVPASVTAIAGFVRLTVTNPDGGNSPGAGFQGIWIDPALTSISPSSIPASKPATITLTGAGFSSTNCVMLFNTNLATTYVSSTTLTAAIPASAVTMAQGYSVTVMSACGGIVSGSRAQTLTVIAANPPVITSLSPASATAGGPAFTLTVNGNFLQAGAYVMWKSTALVTTSVNATQLTASVPASLLASAGLCNVSVVNADGGVSAPSTFTVTAPAPGAPPSISLLTPSSISAGSSAFTLRVLGTNLVSGSVVQWNGTPLTTSLNSTTLNASVPAALVSTAGTATIKVINPDGQTSGTLPFKVAAIPAISSLSPTSVSVSTTAFFLTVNGTGFDSGSYVRWNNMAFPTYYISDTQLSAQVSATFAGTAGSVQITVQNSLGAVSAPVTFNVVAVPPKPQIAGLSPWIVNAGAGFTLTVNGSAFAQGHVVQWNGTALPTSYFGPTQLSAQVASALVAQPGTANITVAASDGSVSNSVSLTIQAGPPLLTSIAPSSVAAGSAGFTLTLNGSNFFPASTVFLGNAALNTTYVNPTQLTALIAANRIVSAGTLSVSVNNPGGVKSYDLPLTVVPATTPALTGINPSTVVAGGMGFNLAVTGTGFQAGCLVLWNGANLGASFSPPNLLIAAVPAQLIASSGSNSIAVQCTGGATSNALTFTVATPNVILNSLNPASATAAGPAFTVTVNGSGFVPGSVVQWNGTALPTNFIGSSQLTALVAAGLIGQPGAANVSVTNPGQTTSSPLSFTISPAPPVVSVLTPAAATAGDPTFTLTLTGTNFAPGAAVLWNGAPVPTTYISALRLTASIPATLIADAGTASISVSAGSTITNSLVFTINPALPVTSQSAIVNAASSVPSIAPGSLISVYGSRLASGSAAASVTPLPTSLIGTSLTINGIAAPLLFVSDFQINAQVPFEIKPGKALMEIQVNGTKGLPVNFDVKATGPGILTRLQDNHALAQNLPDNTLNSAQNPAQPGQYITIYLTGQGQLDNPVPTGEAAPASPLSLPVASVIAIIGGTPAEVQFAGLAPGFVGLLQMNIRIPAVSLGEQILEVSIGGVSALPAAISIGN